MGRTHGFARVGVGRDAKALRPFFHASEVQPRETPNIRKDGETKNASDAAGVPNKTREKYPTAEAAVSWAIREGHAGGKEEEEAIQDRQGAVTRADASARAAATPA